jgi:uroporphyrinogen-III synthase
MRLLVTRPLPDAGETAARLMARGHDVLVEPLLTIVYAPPPAAGLPDPAALIVTSRNGARALARWPQSRGWRNRPVFVTGPATARAIATLGFTDVRVGAGNAAAVAERVRADLVAAGGSILYPAGRDQSGTLADDLSAQGYDVRLIEAYHADAAETLNPAAREALRRRAVGGVLFYSRRTALAFAAIVAKERLAPQVAGVVAFALAEQVADPLRSLALDVHVAAQPDEDSLFRLIPQPA